MRGPHLISHFLLLLPLCFHFTGYNGFPRGCSDDALPWARHGEGGFLDTKYAYVCHAEMNAILNRTIAPLHGERDGGEGGRGWREGGNGHGEKACSFACYSRLFMFHFFCLLVCVHAFSQNFLPEKQTPPHPLLYLTHPPQPSSSIPPSSPPSFPPQAAACTWPSSPAMNAPSSSSKVGSRT